MTHRPVSMPRGVSLALAVALAGVVLPVAARGATWSSSVTADSNIFGAGLTPGAPAPPATPPNTGSGVNPPQFCFTSGSNQVLTFASVSGSVTGSSTEATSGGFVGGVPNGPDGGTNFVPINIAPFGNLSGIQSNDRNMFLVGVFRNDTNSGALPPTLSFDAAARNQATYSPQLNQLFFIGDGKTDAGAAQQFNVPTGATHLYLGFADELFDLTNPASFVPPGPVTPFGAYIDNSGAFDATFSISNAEAVNCAVPEPHVMGLLALALTGLGVRLGRRRGM